MAEVNDEDIERLASRLAMMVSEEGEAENAARAAAQLARRLGITGGHLKEMFLIGASSRPVAASAQQQRRAADADRLEREIAVVRRGAQQLESDLRSAERERDALQAEVEQLRATRFRRHTTPHAQRIIGAAVLVVVIVAGAIGYIVAIGHSAASPPALVASLPGAPVGDERSVIRRFGTIRNAWTLVYSEPDRAAPVIASLPRGSSVLVNRLLWNRLLPWAEVEAHSGIGYVLTTDIDLF